MATAASPRACSSWETTWRARRRPHLPAAAASFAAGCVAQLCGSLCWVPMDTVKERLQVEGQLKRGSKAELGGSWNAGSDDLRREGLWGFYPAYWVHQATWAPLQPPVLRHLRGVQGRRCPRPGQRGGRRRRGWIFDKPDGPGEDAAAGGPNRPPPTFAYAGAFDCVGQILRREGPLGLRTGR